MTGIVVIALAVALASAFAVYRRRTDGRVRSVEAAASSRITEQALGAGLGQSATLLQISAPICAPCRASKTLLADVSAGRPDVRFVEVHGEDRMDLVRDLDITRTPTVLVLDAGGRVRHRVVGVPARDEIESVLATVGAA